MKRDAILKHLHAVRETLLAIGRDRRGSFGISAMDLKKVLDQTVRELRREVNKKVLKVPEIEIKVCEATSNEPWGPHGTIMGDIAQATRNFQEYHLIMGVLWKRLHDSGKNWRHVYKSLTVMEYLIANGAERVIDEVREQAYQIQALLDFQYIEPNGKDQGINVQKKAQSMLALINDRGKIRELRQKAAANRDKYRGLSSTGMSTFKPSSYLSTSGSYGEKEEEQYGGRASSTNDDGNGKEPDCPRSQRGAESNRDECSCGDREHNESCAASKGGDPNSDKGSSTEGDHRSHNIDESRQYSRAPGSRGMVAAVTRAQTNIVNLSSQSTSSGATSSQLKGGRENLFFTINPAAAAADDFDDFDPRGTSSKTCSAVVPAGAKDSEPSTQSQHHALEDLFADVEFQASYPPISATSSNNSDYLQTSYAFSQASKPVPSAAMIPPPPLNNSAMKAAEFQPFSLESLSPQIDGIPFDNFNPSFASFDESPKSATTQPGVGSGPSHLNFVADHEQFKVGSASSPTLDQSPTKSPDNSYNNNNNNNNNNTLDLFGSFNPFATALDHGMDANRLQAQPQPQPQPQPYENPFLSTTTTTSAFWDDPLITSLVDLSIGAGSKQEQNAPLSMNEIGVNRAGSVPAGAATLSMARHMIGPGRFMSELPKSS